jgi:putative spermidine/putrescine transport system ATP-binding protein
MPFLSVEGLDKYYGLHRAVAGVSFSVEKGECLALLGPSGCGKTTLLNIVAGFIAPNAGDVRVDGRTMNGVPPHRRGMGMVFQDYALFPHLTVAENVEFGLRMRGVESAARRRSAERTLDLVGLGGFGGRSVQQLSGGQRQRVAVARALAIEPALLLFDEPLSNLDARLRDTMRTEIRALLTRTRITALFVTHDQAEAFAVADRVALLNAGRLEQIGQLDEIYERPANRFVASFLGNCNLIEGLCVQRNGSRATIEALGTRFSGTYSPQVAQFGVNDSITLAIRPHNVSLVSARDGELDNRLKVTVDAVEYLGWLTKVTVRHSTDTTVNLEVSGKSGIEVGDVVDVGWRAEHAWVISEPASGGERRS